ncbi:MAG: hypothetical protein OK456_01300 [Thaumarchaeota archaeon]|nr:hypothetical protein [Nitrososphaerota archaeon]
MPPEDEAQIDAKLKETDRAIADLQKQRQQLLAAKAALGKGAVPQPSQPQPELSEKALEKALNMLEWNSFKKKDGEWAFLRKRDGSLVEDLLPIVGFIDQLRHGKRLVVGKYEYVASEDKFLNRYFAGT